MSENVGDRRRVIYTCEGESLTQQHMSNDVNINNIMSRYQKTGVIDMSLINNAKGQYLDCTQASDYRSVCDQINAIHDMFDRLPAEVRRRLDNSPEYMLDVMANDREFAQELGLIPDDSPAEPVIAKQPEGSEQSGDGRAEANAGS